MRYSGGLYGPLGDFTVLWGTVRYSGVQLSETVGAAPLSAGTPGALKGYSGVLWEYSKGTLGVLEGAQALGPRYGLGTLTGTLGTHHGTSRGTHGYPQVLAHAWAGFNATLFAYGQTGSGKTHTMVGEVGGTESPGSIGVPREYRREYPRVPPMHPRLPLQRSRRCNTKRCRRRRAMASPAEYAV